MIKILIFADSYKHFNSAIKEYEKRLGRSFKVEKLKPSKKTESRDVIKEETGIVSKKLEKIKGYKVVLNPKSKDLNTYEFEKLISDNKMIFPNIVFVIGGAYGLDYDLLRSKVNKELSLGKFIMPHSLALLVLVEQIYRAMMIEKGSKYHK